MIAPIFVDTHVLVYARDASDPSKQPQAMAVLRQLWATKSGRVSTQFLHCA